MASDGNLYNIYDNNINPDPQIGLKYVLPSQVDAFKKLGYKDETSQPYIPIHTDYFLQQLGKTGAALTNGFLNGFGIPVAQGFINGVRWIGAKTAFSINQGITNSTSAFTFDKITLPSANLSANKPIGIFGQGNLRETFSKDIFIRGGVSAPSYAAEDAFRLTKFFLDKRDITGLLFSIKQNVLSLTSVRTIASPPFINGGIYLPTSTIAQAGVNAFGIHLNKQGIDPTGKLKIKGKGGFALKTYEEAANEAERKISNKRERLEKRKSRLITKRDKIPSSTSSAEDLTRKEKIQANRRIGLDNKIKAINEEIDAFEKGLLYSLYENKIFLNSFDDNNVRTYLGGPGSILGIGITRIKFADKKQRTGFANIWYNNEKYKNKFLYGGIDFTKLYKPTTEGNVRNLDGVSGLKEGFVPIPLYRGIERPNYSQFNVEATYNFNSPGKKGNITNYTKGKENSNKTVEASDKINGYKKGNFLPFTSVYKQPNPKYDDDLRDIINFRIGVIDNSGANLKDTYWMPFRAFIDDFSDSYKGKWKSQYYMGRAEQFYKYDSFDRDISLGFTIAAQSQDELMVQWEKLNFLASTLAPTYSKYGYMSGNLHRIYIGGYLEDQICIIESLSFDFKDSPWEIGINTVGNLRKDNISQLPHYIKVKMKLAPIHKFRVEMDRDGNKKYIARSAPQGSSSNITYQNTTNLGTISFEDRFNQTLSDKNAGVPNNSSPGYTPVAGPTSTSTPTPSLPSTPSPFNSPFPPGLENQIKNTLGLWLGP